MKKGRVGADKSNLSDHSLGSLKNSMLSKGNIKRGLLRSRLEAQDKVQRNSKEGDMHQRGFHF